MEETEVGRGETDVEHSDDFGSEAAAPPRSVVGSGSFATADGTSDGAEAAPTVDGTWGTFIVEGNADPEVEAF
jgi:hypothetical protein